MATTSTATGSSAHHPTAWFAAMSAAERTTFWACIGGWILDAMDVQMLSFAIPAIKAGFRPDSISTDIHAHSMNAGMKDMLNVMDKFLAVGVPLASVVMRATWHPAREI